VIAPGTDLHLYVHVPFCARRCPYCHFYNLGHADGREALYLDALEAELAAWRREGAFDGRRLATLYWGGGTPSILTAGGFQRLARATLGVAPRAADLEWTIEANPDDATPGRMAAWHAAGASRISIGVQSFDAQRLAFLERVHGVQAARAAVESAARAGFPDISVDLMFNLAVPGRRRAWARDLAVAFDLPITHLSLYGLTIEPGTGFAARADRGAVLTTPDAAAAAEYRAACRAARRAGFEHYEVSSFARPGHRSRHNQAYWRSVPYLGVGPAAHSFDGRRRWANVASLTGWAEALSTGGDPRAFVEELYPRERAIETLYLGLRRAEGVPSDHPLLVGPGARALLASLVASGHVHREENRVACTGRGLLVLDEILERLVGADPGVPSSAEAPAGLSD